MVAVLALLYAAYIGGALWWSRRRNVLGKASRQSKGHRHRAPEPAQTSGVFPL
jgi:hypothetical protein